MQRMLEDFIVFSGCLILITMDSAREHGDSPEMQSSQPNPDTKGELGNICHKTNQDLGRIPGHATQVSAGFVRNIHINVSPLVELYYLG